MAVVLAVWYLVGMAFAKRVKWSVITNIFSYPPLDFSYVKSLNKQDPMVAKFV